MMKMWVTLRPFRAYAHLTQGEECWPHGVSTERVKDLMWAIESTGRYAPKGINCLPRALALQRMLIRRGGRATIHFGVRRGAEGVEAHAWVTLRDKVLLGGLPNLNEYAVLSSWPSERKS